MKPCDSQGILLFLDHDTCQRVEYVNPLTLCYVLKLLICVLLVDIMIYDLGRKVGIKEEKVEIWIKIVVYLD